MIFLKKINVFRRKLTKTLTSSIGKNETANKPFTKDTKIQRILVSRPNHRLGNQLLMTPLLQELQSIFPDSKIDLFVKGGVSNVIFKNYTQVNKIISLPRKHFKELFSYFKAWFVLKNTKYDLAINVAKNSSSGRISVKIANAAYKIYGNENETANANPDDLEHIAKQPVYTLRAELKRLGLELKNEKIPSLSLQLDAKEISEGKENLEKIVQNNAKTIALFTYATGDKCYSTTWWETFYSDIKGSFPDMNFVEILPVENISQLSFKIPTYYSKEIREITALIANTAIFIGADSGMMHLAAASGTPTIGLFSVTNPVTYAPYGNHNRGINTNTTSNQEIINQVKAILQSN